MDAIVNPLRSALGRWRRRRFRHTTNAPYLSGDLFRSMADVVVEPGVAPSGARLAAGRVIFVKTDLLRAFVADAAAARECRVLITGNSDHEIHDVPRTLPPKLVRWFAQNTFETSSILEPLPIGLENAALGNNGRPSLFRACRPAEVARKRLRAFAAFGPTTASRQGLIDVLEACPTVDVERRRLPPARFQATLRAYRFVIAPRGNGVDTHRFWEALYADAIPITARSAWSAAIAAAGVPVIEVDDWRELRTWTERDLAARSREWPERPSALPWLWEPFWRNRIVRLASA